MSVLIRNNYLKGRSLITPLGTVEFDKDGISDVDDAVAELLFELGGYEAVVDQPEANSEPTKVSEGVSTQEPEETAQEPVSDDSEGENEPEVEVVEPEGEPEEAIDLKTLNVPQLKKYARLHGIDITGASKKDELLAVISSASK